MTNRRLILAAGVAGLAGSLCLFVGDQLVAMAAELGSRNEGLGRSGNITLGTLLAVPGGVGLVLGLNHVKARLSPAPGWARGVVTLLLLTLFVLATATHSAWGASHLEVTGLAPDASSSNIYLFLVMPLRDLGSLVGIPATLGLLALTILGRTAWPRWMVLANPGLIHFAIDIALDASRGPFGPVLLVIYAGTFNLSWMVFFAVSALAPWREAKS